MDSSRQLIETLLAANFEIKLGSFSCPLTQPFWVHADDTKLLLTHHDDHDIVTVELAFTHHQTLLKFGEDIATVGSMIELCVSEWFPDLERGFKKIADRFDLTWNNDGDDTDGMCPWIIYRLAGKFKSTETDRLLALIFEIRSVLGSKDCPS